MAEVISKAIAYIIIGIIILAIIASFVRGAEAAYNYDYGFHNRYDSRNYNRDVSISFGPYGNQYYSGYYYPHHYSSNYYHSYYYPSYSYPSYSHHGYSGYYSQYYYPSYSYSYSYPYYGYYESY